MPYLGEKTIVLGMSGGIACYKAVELVRTLVKEGAKVRVIMTAGAQQFVRPLTLQTLSGEPVATDTFDLTQESEIGHIRLADSADVLLIAPATANVIAKLAHGLADDLLTTVAMATRAPIVVAPAMNVNMFQNRVVQENLEHLRQLGMRIVDPEEGFLACGYEGQGRLASEAALVEGIRSALTPQSLAGERVLVTAGPTREAIDPVRFVSNRSSGKMGYALARAGLRRGASVALVSGPTSLEPPAGARLISVTTAAEMRRAVLEEFPNCTAVIMAAAVSDYRPSESSSSKMKRGKGSWELRLEPNPDILKELGAKKDGKLLVGFAAETDDPAANAKKKMRDKNLDMIVANDVTQEGSGFDGDTNIATIVDRSGASRALPLMTKDELSDQILDHLLALKSKR